MKQMEQIAQAINTLGEFLGMRDVPKLTQKALMQRFGFARVDVMVLFGGSILCGGDVLADAMRAGVAERYVIVGGAGHTTETLRQQMCTALPGINTEGRTEAELFAAYLRRRCGLVPDALECRSTNCGNNITFLLELLRQKGWPCRRILLTQDAAMQRRMDAVLRKEGGDAVTPVNYAAYRVQVVCTQSGLAFQQTPAGMWTMERYISLLLGEIPRLTDDADGYGPRGKGFLAHVEVPSQAAEAFSLLRAEYPRLVRQADPAFAGR